MHMTHDYATTLVVKYGGNAMAGPAGGPDPLLAEVAARWNGGQAVVLVHGGGPEIDAALAQRGVASERIDGQRVTDATTLEVTEAVLCGSLNKRLVRACTMLGLPAVGISGEDGGTLVARRAKGINGEDLGYVGEIACVEPKLIQTLLAQDFFRSSRRLRSRTTPVTPTTSMPTSPRARSRPRCKPTRPSWSPTFRACCATSRIPPRVSTVSRQIRHRSSRTRARAATA